MAERSTSRASEALASSFRDPSGFLYRRDGVLLRAVDASYRAHYEHLLSSGLYQDLVDEDLLVAHTEEPLDGHPPAYRILRPSLIPFVSYPYEWCFSQLKAAALLTLEVQERAMSHGMVLKDASAFNVQFRGVDPVFVDTLSFEVRDEAKPWAAYRQFCQHFLAPLLLMSEVDARLGNLLSVHLDGIPLDLTSSLLPTRDWLRPSRVFHVHLHSRSISHFGRRNGTARRRRGAHMSDKALGGLISNLRSMIEGLDWRPENTTWADYMSEHTYGDTAFEEKRRRVAEYLDGSGGRTVWDLGANTGAFSQVAAKREAEVLSIDSDPGAVELNYRETRRAGLPRILPLMIDLTAPSPAVGWANEERLSLEARGPADAVLALALVHHLAISNNVPLAMLAGWFARLTRDLIIEFVPKSDSQVQRLLSSREDIFDSYTKDGFEAAFQAHFEILRDDPIGGTQRCLYFMRKRKSARGSEIE